MPTSPPTAGLSGPVFTVGSSLSLRHYPLHSGDANGPVTYFVHSRMIAHRKPSMEIHLGSSEKDPVVAFAFYRSNWRGATFMLGDSNGQIMAEDAPDTGSIKDGSRFSYTKFIVTTPELDGAKRRFLWRWKYKGGIEAECSELGPETDTPSEESAEVEDPPGRIVGRFEAKKLLMKTLGTLQFADGLEQRLQLSLLTAFMATCDWEVKTWSAVLAA